MSYKNKGLHALFCLVQTRNMNFSLLFLGLQSYARDQPTAFWILKSKAHSSGLTTAVLHSIATSCTVVTKGLLPHQKFLSEGDNPSHRNYQTRSHQDVQPPTNAGLYRYFLTSLYCFSAWLLYRFTVD